MFCVGSNPPETNAKPPTLFSFSSPFKRLRVERWRIYDVLILSLYQVLSRKMEESSLLERFCSDYSLFASTQGRRFEKGFWYLEYLQHVFESRGFQFSDSDHAVGDSVESCKDESKPQKCPN
ncbi:unnamed protein product [Brassica oleracea]